MDWVSESGFRGVHRAPGSRRAWTVGFSHGGRRRGLLAFCRGLGCSVGREVRVHDSGVRSCRRRRSDSQQDCCIGGGLVGYQDCLGTTDEKGGCRKSKCCQSSSESPSYSSGSAIAYKRRWYSWFRQGDRACCSSGWNRSQTVGGACHYDWACWERQVERCPRFGSQHPQDETQYPWGVRRRARSWGPRSTSHGSREERSDVGCPHEAHHYRWFTDLTKAEIEAGRHTGRLGASARRGQLSFCQFKQKTFCRHPKPEESIESDPIIGRFVRGCTPIFFVLETCSSGHIREPAHQTVASYMGRSVHVEDQGAGRFCGKASDAWEEESMGEARWKTRGSSDHLAKGRSKEKAGKGGGKGGKNQDSTGGGAEEAASSSNHWCKIVILLWPEFNPQLQSGSGQKAEFDAEAPPGSRATTVHPGAWWAASFRFCMQLGSSFGQFLRSFHKKPSSSSNGRGTVTFWPMPLPYPRVFKQCISTKDFDLKKTQFQKGVNLTIACLNWLHLRRPQRCPEEICLFLSKVQWRIVKFIEEVMVAWSDCEPVTSEAMGRSASKVEDIEAALGRLASLEMDVGVMLDEVSATASGSPVVERNHFSFAPGLQSESAGEVFARLDGGSPVVAKKIVASRLDFKGEPKFDPSPFLDVRSRKVFESPIAEALRPGEAREDPPCVRIFGKQEEVWQLLVKLDATGRLGGLRECDVLEGYQAGLFAVGKSSTHDRLIFDSRPFNTLEIPLRRWISSMGAASNLCDIQLDESEVLITTGTDLREFYYSFQVGQERLRRNSLLIRVMPSDLVGFRCYNPEWETEGRPVVLGLRTLQLGLLNQTNLLAMGLPPPRGNFFGGVVIDDLILFEKVAKASLESTIDFHSSQQMAEALNRYKMLGLLPHEGKTFYGSVDSEFWGASLNGKKGQVRANLKRVIPVVYATLGVLKLGICTVSLLEILIGCWTSIFLFKRRLLSLLNVCYDALQRQEDRRSVLRLSGALKDELLLVLGLAPLAATYLSARDSAYLYESDASTWGVAVCRARLPRWLQSEIHRHRLRKQVWSKLLSPSRSLLRVKGLLPPAEELPDGQTFASHPLHIELGTCLQFEVLEKRAAVRQVHINVLELRGMVRSERLAALEHFPGRSFALADSQVALGAWLKGRSSSIVLNQELQQSLPIHLGCGMISNAGYIPSEVNATDDPTRHRAVRKPEKSPESWMFEENFPNLDEQLKCFDQWLQSYQADPYSISGLPDMDELREPVGCDMVVKSRAKLFFEKNN